ncbi:MAG: hypothetical protein HY985_02650 [Magnetospirillum sp.]|nr:hypothetical protein [Magnetospirillum sp.]
MTDWNTVSEQRLAAMAAAAAEIGKCLRVLNKSGLNLVGEVLRGFGEFTEFEHYPPDDVYDPETHAQYYFHAHSPGEREWSDYGHFHIFLRPKGMPPGIRPMPIQGVEPPSGENEALCHLVAISMTREGLPERLFTTNRWVTAETWYAGDDVIRMLDRCVFDIAWPSWPLNRWLTAMLVLFRPQIEDLIRRRDEVVREWLQGHPGEDVFENRRLEIASALDISLERQLGELGDCLKSRRLRGGGPVSNLPER